jgi:hypothetical protein
MMSRDPEIEQRLREIDANLRKIAADRRDRPLIQAMDGIRFKRRERRWLIGIIIGLGLYFIACLGLCLYAGYRDRDGRATDLMLDIVSIVLLHQAVNSLASGK